MKRETTMINETNQRRCDASRRHCLSNTDDNASSKSAGRHVVDLVQAIELYGGALKAGAMLAEQQVVTFNGHVRELFEMGLFPRDCYLGPIVLSRGYGLDGPTDSGELVQAVLCTQSGAAAVHWDTEEYQTLNQEDDLAVSANDRAVPLQQCAPAIQALVRPTIPRLLDRLLNSVTIG